MNRFRPNIVVRGDAPFAEDKWVYLHAGELELNLRKPCGRCKARILASRHCLTEDDPGG